MESLAARADYLCTEAGVSYARISVAAGLSRGAFRLICLGKRRGEGATLGRIAEATGSSTDWLISGVGRPPKKRRILAAIERAEARDWSEVA